MAPSKAKPIRLVVFYAEPAKGEDPYVVFNLSCSTDWSVFAEDILEIKGSDGEAVYIPIAQLKGWTVKPHGN
jgi:hypothetical protein